MDKKRSNWDKFFKSNEGRYVLWQNPNLPLWVWLASAIASTLFMEGAVHRLFDALAYGAIIAWSYLELTQGVNYFRRSLGGIILLLAVSGRVY